MRKLANWCLVFLACLVMMARQAQSTSYTASSFTSVTAAADEKLLAKVPEADPYVGTKLGTLREGYCTNLSDVGSPTVADLLERIEEQTQKLSKYFFMTGKLPVSVLISLIKASKASRVLELGAYTGYSAVAMAGTGAHVTTIDSFKDDPPAEEIFNSAVVESKLDISLMKMPALEALSELGETCSNPFDFVFIDAGVKTKNHPVLPF